MARAVPSVRDGVTWSGALAMLLLGTAAGVAVFSTLSRPELGSDVPLHIGLVIDGRTEDTRLGYTIFYGLLELASNGGDAEAVRRAAVVVLAISYGLRLAVTWFLFSLAGVHMKVRVAATVVTAIAAPLTLAPGGYYHLGKLSPVLWHNSTVVLAVPFALLLFASTWWVMVRPERAWSPQVVQVALVVASGWTKPNYLLALVPALALLCAGAVWAAGTGNRLAVFKDLWWRAAPTGIAASAVLVTQYLGTYAGPGLVIQGQSVTNTIAPFAVWNEWSTRFGVAMVPSLLVSIVPPAMLSVMVWRTERYRYPLALAWTSLVVGVVQFTVLAEVLEDGSILFHGNWIWGAQLSMAVLFAACVGAFAHEFASLGRLKWIPAVVVVYQAAMGVLFFALILGASR